MGLLGLILIGIGAFASTNIDDLFVIVLFLSEPSFKASQVVIGQYVGIGSLVVISALAAILALVLPTRIIALMGVLPIAIGTKKLIELHKQGLNRNHDKIPSNEKFAFLSIATITFSNGGDNIGVYVPLFANNSALSDMATLIVIFLIMTALWCSIGYYLVNHEFAIKYIRRIARPIFPFVLIGLGVYILVKPLFL